MMDELNSEDKDSEVIDAKIQEQELNDQELSTISGGTHTITSPRDPASGLPTGKRQHKPFTILSDLDS